MKILIMTIWINIRDWVKMFSLVQLIVVMTITESLLENDWSIGIEASCTDGKQIQLISNDSIVIKSLIYSPYSALGLVFSKKKSVF